MRDTPHPRGDSAVQRVRARFGTAVKGMEVFQLDFLSEPLCHVHAAETGLALGAMLGLKVKALITLVPLDYEATCADTRAILKEAGL